MPDEDGTKGKINWTHFVIGLVLLLGILAPAIGWLSSFLWMQFLGGLW